MGYVCHTNKCCQSNSPKQYKNTDLFTQKEYSWPHWSHSNSSLLFFSCCYGTGVTKIVVFGWKISVIILLFWVTLATFIFVTNMIHLTFAMRHGSLLSKTDLMMLVFVNLVDLWGPGPVPIFFRLVRFFNIRM